MDRPFDVIEERILREMQDGLAIGRPGWGCERVSSIVWTVTSCTRAQRSFPA